MKTSFTHGLGRPGSLGTLPLRKQKTTFPLNADTPQTVLVQEASISK